MQSELAKLITEGRNPNSIDIDLRSTEEIVRIFHEEDQKALAAVSAESASIAQAADLITEAFRRDGRLFYIGAGTSGRLGVLDASECPPTFSTEPSMVQGIIAGGDGALRRSVEAAEDKPEAGAQAIREHGVAARDVVVGIASSGRTPYVLGALEEAHCIGAKTVFLCCAPPADSVAGFVDVFIVPIAGPEIIAGSTRLKAGTATKLVLNMLTTTAMIRLGKVYGNMMVDLQMNSRKLEERSKKIVMMITGLDYQKAKEILVAADGHVKTAIVMALAGINAASARQRLEASDGFVKGALKAR